MTERRPILTSAAMVVIAQNHNPSILNPDFLIRNEIIDGSWGSPLQSEMFSTPAFSVVKYQQVNVTITCQEERLQFEKSTTPQDQSFKDALKAIQRYVQVLPHVNFKAVGLNFRYEVIIQDSLVWMRERYLQKSSIDIGAKLEGVRLLLRYLLEDAVKLTLDIRPDGEVVRVLANENHEAGSEKDVSRVLRNADERHRFSAEKVQQLLGRS